MKERRKIQSFGSYELQKCLGEECPAAKVLELIQQSDLSLAEIHSSSKRLRLLCNFNDLTITPPYQLIEDRVDKDGQPIRVRVFNGSVVRAICNRGGAECGSLTMGDISGSRPRVIRQNRIQKFLNFLKPK